MTTDTTGPLSRARVATRLPARDLDRARRFHAEKLGLGPARRLTAQTRGLARVGRRRCLSAP
ncbi:hypothetical protein GCM10014715_29900 [Streptomyces spiralis]|uniref:Glyoxalase n=1 Tax=Streptomyces spiralis TaxID=66376 RepID=A0A918ZXA1_9ACTN|nr:hypothetical protein GCM10014715_29900 [Streptomyces spiralis]